MPFLVRNSRNAHSILFPRCLFSLFRFFTILPMELRCTTFIAKFQIIMSRLTSSTVSRLEWVWSRVSI